MNFVKVGPDKEKHFIVKDQIGHWSVTQHTCDKCGLEHYVFAVYDRKGFLLCSMIGTKDEMNEWSKQISDGICPKELSPTDQSEDTRKASKEG